MVIMQQLYAQVTSDVYTGKNFVGEQREKIIIQTNQQLYRKGDTIWIRCHLVDGATQIPSTSPEYSGVKSKYVYVEFHDCLSDTLVHRYKIKADSLGVFANAIAIPDNIKEGYYMLVAYTRWMMNFSDKNYGYREIYVMGDDNMNTTSSVRDKNLTVQIYPEGGVLVPRHIQNIIYTIMDSQHCPKKAEVRLVNKGNDSIVAYSHTEYDGLGQLYFCPEEGQHYCLEAYTDSGAYGRYDICTSIKDGVTLQIKRRKSLVLINIVSQNYDISKLQLLIYNNGCVSAIDTLEDSVVLSSDTFKKGKVTFILVDSSDYSILSTRTIFVK